ncbi:MAG: hypothetical protein E7462_04385 [Ruminococcaceae bacterium]|nr:hypothetical protein [Oscillospiraceae bacterium]
MLKPFETQQIPDETFAYMAAENAVKESEQLLFAINRVLLEKYNGVMLHGAVIEYNGQGYMFAAHSGTGKTTHIRLWEQCFGQSVRVLCGDKPFVRLTQNGEVVVYGSAWRGKEGMGYNGKCRLAGIYLLNRAQENRIFPATTVQKLQGLMHAALFEKDLQQVFLTVAEEICKRVPIHVLECNKEPQAAILVKEHVDGDAKD